MVLNMANQEIERKFSFRKADNIPEIKKLGRRGSKYDTVIEEFLKQPFDIGTYEPQKEFSKDELTGFTNALRQRIKDQNKPIKVRIRENKVYLSKVKTDQKEKAKKA